MYVEFFSPNHTTLSASAVKIHLFLILFIFIGTDSSFGQDKPDLGVIHFSVLPTIQAPGEPVIVNYRVRDEGTADVTTDFSIGFDYSYDSSITTSDIYHGRVPYSNLSVGSYFPPQGNARISVRAPRSAVPEDRYIGAYVDATNSVPETNEHNNTFGNRIIIRQPSLPDLQVTDVSVTPSRLAPGETATVSYRIQNIGSTDASDGLRIGFYYANNIPISTYGRYLGRVRIPSLNAGDYFPASGEGTVTIRVPRDAVRGTRYIGVWVDYNNHVGESNEGNNIRGFMITVR